MTKKANPSKKLCPQCEGEIIIKRNMEDIAGIPHIEEQPRCSRCDLVCGSKNYIALNKAYLEDKQ